MRAISQALQTFLDTATTATFRHLVTITLSDGSLRRWTDHTADITIGGDTWTAGGTSTVPLLRVGTRRDPAGTEIGECELVLFGGETATLTGIRLPLAVLNDVLDRAKVKIERVYGPDIIDLNLGTMHVFEGVVAEVETSSTQVTLSLVDAREELSVKLPRTPIQPPCTAMLYDSQCMVSKVARTVTATVAAGSTAWTLNTNRAEADGYFGLGVLTFDANTTTVALRGTKRAVRAYRNASGAFDLTEALPSTPVAGDTFTVYPGCNKSFTDANGCPKFANQEHFRGFPLLPAETTDTRALWTKPGKLSGDVYGTGWSGIGENVTPPALTLPLVYGRQKVKGQVVYRYGPYTSGNGTAVVIAFCEGPIVGTRRCWVNDKFYGAVPLMRWTSPTMTWLYDVFSVGNRPHGLGWAWIGHNDPAYGLLHYPGVAYWGAFYRLLPAGSSETYEVEIDGFLSNAADAGADGDAHPASIIADATYGLLPNAEFGAGFAWPVVTDVGPDGTADSSARRYLTAAGIRLSPLIDSQRSAVEILQELLESCNCSCRMSDGSLEIIPLGDVRFGTAPNEYIPDTTVQYALTEDHLLTDGGDPISVKRPGREEVSNIVPVEFVERGADPASENAYASRSIEDPEPVDVAQNGPRRGGSVSLPMITLPDVALTISRLRAQRAVKRRNTYTFRVGYRYAPLEPLDYLSLSDTKFGLVSRVVRVKSIEEDEDGTLTIEAEDAPLGMSHAVAHPVQSSESSFVGKPWADLDARLALQATTTWTAVTLPAGHIFYGVAWSGARWVQVGDQSGCVTTDDPFGMTGWTARTMPAGTYRSVASDGAGTVVAVGDAGLGAISTDDGATWVASPLPAGAYNDVVWDAANGVWVAVGTSVCATSPTGTAGTWTARTAPAGYSMMQVAFNGAVLVAIGVDGAMNRCVAVSSSDGGVTWTNATVFAGTSLRAVTAHGARFLIGGLDTTIRASDDGGVTWNTLTDASPREVYCLASDGYVVLGLYVHNTTSAPGEVSADGGVTWTRRTLAYAGNVRVYNRVAFNGYCWVAALQDYGGVTAMVSQSRSF